jgi:hypothetical protein
MKLAMKLIDVTASRTIPAAPEEVFDVWAVVRRPAREPRGRLG